MAETICEVLAEPFTFIGKEIFVGASIGIALYPADGTDINTLVKRADTAMFRAKETGSKYQFYESGMGAVLSKRLEIESELRRALEREELLVYYQPKVDLGLGKVTGMEALLRWQHPEKGMIPPLDFSPLAEETGMINDIGTWVLQTACAQTQAWNRQGFGPLSVAVNISGRQLEQPDFVEKVAAILNDTGLPSSRLEMEITESVIMAHADEVIVILNQLKEMGVILSIDDFGTGYSSLSYLKRFPIDLLKVDRSFVKDIEIDPDDRAIVRGIIVLAKSLDIKVVAEGVETAGQEAFLKDLNCDQVQGYYYSRPLSTAVFEQQILRKITPIDKSAQKVTPIRTHEQNQ